MARADTPPLTHRSPAGSDCGLPVTPTPGSPRGVSGGHATLWGCGSGAGFMAPHSPPMMSSKSLSMSMSMGMGMGNHAPETMKQAMDVDMDENVDKQHKARAVAVHDDVIDDEADETDGPILTVNNKRRTFGGFKGTSPSGNAISTTFIMPRLREVGNYSPWSDIHFNIQQYFVYNGFPLIGIFHTFTDRASRVQVVTPKELVGAFEDTVKSICKQVANGNHWPIRIERGQCQ